MANKIFSEQVSPERWEAAQQWEEQHWIGAQRARARFGKNYIWRLLSAFGFVAKYRGDDWNSWWKKQFDEYRFLPPKVKNALEVGCGPYTNLRLTLETCRPDHVCLSDPLIRTYVKFKLTFVAEMYRKALCVLDDHPLEELPFADNYFDLTIMINVLDHVRDAPLCMEKLIRVTKPGGIVILGQDLSNDEDLEALVRDGGAVGHPIKLDYDWFQPYLEKNFEPIIHKVLPRAEGREADKHYATLVFAGRKR
ncbi:MAG TPA: class I SAM-dependent methyltransferase [Verrucomicrobiae bacterium]|jgi:ubiquinone/menaquinone biosynthesis C-methylase UbiE